MQEKICQSVKTAIRNKAVQFDADEIASLQEAAKNYQTLVKDGWVIKRSFSLQTLKPTPISSNYIGTRKTRTLN